MTSRSSYFVPLVLALVAGAGCAPAKRYRPAPISPLATATAYEQRTLADPALKAFLEKNLRHAVGRWPLETWDLPSLELAALYFNPAMAVARARTARAEAAVTTAGARPNPSLSLAPGVPSPYLFGLSFSLPVETAGKRGYRIRRATALSEAAQLELAGTAWQVQSELRSALLNYFVAQRETQLFEDEEKLLTVQVKLSEKRLSAGENARPAADAARLALVNTQLSLRAAQGRVEQTRDALAAAIGISAVALDGLRLEWAQFDHPPEASAFSAKQIQRDAVLDRLDVRQALAAYAATEAGLQLEIARQYPDFRIGPGYQFEESNNFFTVGFSITLPIFNRNQGPIAEAEARRKQAAAEFLAIQAGAIAQSEQALARYQSARAGLEEARTTLSKLQNTRERMALRAVALGEMDRLALNTMRLETVAAERQELAALVATQDAFGALENAVERPLAGEGFLPSAPPQPKPSGAHP
jgi:outer membrane protein, heavy metal efflux system